MHATVQDEVADVEKKADDSEAENVQMQQIFLMPASLLLICRKLRTATLRDPRYCPTRFSTARAPNGDNCQQAIAF